jgi:hypothetical protein
MTSSAIVRNKTAVGVKRYELYAVCPTAACSTKRCFTNEMLKQMVVEESQAKGYVYFMLATL